MKVVIVALALVAVASAAVVPLEVKQVIQILRSKFDQTPEGGYNFNFETENGIKREETGEVKTVPDEKNEPHQVVVVRGQYSYVNVDGNTETIKFYADETGYHAEGPSIPVPVQARR